jgi:hypothetical protein
MIVKGGLPWYTYYYMMVRPKRIILNLDEG